MENPEQSVTDERLKSRGELLEFSRAKTMTLTKS